MSACLTKLNRDQYQRGSIVGQYHNQWTMETWTKGHLTLIPFTFETMRKVLRSFTSVDFEKKVSFPLISVEVWVIFLVRLLIIWLVNIV